MALEDTEIIDDILQPDDERRIGLVISDCGAVTDPKQRLNLLRKKLEHYVEAATEGSVHPKYRYTDPNDFYVDVICVRPPTKEMLRIDQVVREGDTKHRLKVHYREGRKGEWAETSAAEAATPLENLATDSLNPLIAAAFEAGHNCLRAGEAPPLLLFVKNSQPYLLPMKGLESDEQVTSVLARWASENASEVSSCILLRFSPLENDGRQTDAFVAHVFQHGLKEGMVLAQELYEDNGTYHVSGRFLFLGCCENTLIAADPHAG